MLLFEFNMILPLWVMFNILRSSQMSKEYLVESKQFVSLSALPFHKEFQLINYQDLTQDTLFICLYLIRWKVTHNGKMLSVLISTAYVIT